MLISNILIVLFLSIIFLLYIQFSPQMGNVWWRNNNFCPVGAYKVIIYPLKEIKMWNIEMWDINYFLWIIFGLFICNIKTLLDVYNIITSHTNHYY